MRCPEVVTHEAPESLVWFEQPRAIEPDGELCQTGFVHDVVESKSGEAEPATIIGMMADEPDVMAEVTRLATTARQASRMRPTDG
ncbi:MAG: hypothetical protein HYZ29_07890 [Myxococcales bacterium]|nr:hypothetical protein [Myxococcales bacterium]